MAKVVIVIQNNGITILVDIDDVINNLCQAWVKYLNEKYDKDARYEDIHEWSMQSLYPDLTEDEIYLPLLEDDFWKTVLPRFDAIKYLHALINEGYDVYLVTSSYYKTIAPKYEHLILKYYPFIEWDKVIVAAKKQMIKGDIMIDDAVHNLEGGSYLKILVTAPHNRNYDTASNGMLRANNWEEIYAIIHGDK